MERTYGNRGKGGGHNSDSDNNNSESDNERNNAISKLTTKNLDLVVLNSLNDKDAGFGIGTNKITLIDSDRNIEEFDSKSKYDVAKDIFNKILKIKK